MLTKPLSLALQAGLSLTKPIKDCKSTQKTISFGKYLQKCNFSPSNQRLIYEKVWIDKSHFSQFSLIKVNAVYSQFIIKILWRKKFANNRTQWSMYGILCITCSLALPSLLVTIYVALYTFTNSVEKKIVFLYLYYGKSQGLIVTVHMTHAAGSILPI